jgi:hypothetical protein
MVGTNYVFGHLQGRVNKGSNSVCDLLHHVVKAAKESDHPCSYAKKLQIQMDGGSENSNHTLFSWCATLIEMGWFDIVEVNVTNNNVT